MDSSSTFFYSFSVSTTFPPSSSTQNDPSAPPPTTITIPIESPRPVSISRDAAAVKIQSSYRSHLTRGLVRRLAAADTAAARLEALIRMQETVDAVRRDERERVRVGEALMAVLLKLDGVRGFYAPVRGLRRRVARRLVGLQEVLDAVAEERVGEGLEGFPMGWEDVVFGTYGGASSAAAEADEEEEEEEEVGREEEGCFDNGGMLPCDY